MSKYVYLGLYRIRKKFDEDDPLHLNCMKKEIIYKLLRLTV